MAAAVLIVEDQTLIAWHLREIVEQAGLRVVDVARAPDEALDAARRDRPDFALMDVRLAHDTSGIDAARLLYECFGVRCIFISANIDVAMRKRVAGYRPLGFVGKPFLRAELLDALRHAEACISQEDGNGRSAGTD